MQFLKAIYGYIEIVLSKWIRKEEKWKKFQIGKVVSLTKLCVFLKYSSQAEVTNSSGFRSSGNMTCEASNGY